MEGGTFLKVITFILEYSIHGQRVLSSPPHKENPISCSGGGVDYFSLMIISEHFPFRGLQGVDSAFGDWSPWKQVNGAASLPVWRKRAQTLVPLSTGLRN